MASVWSELADWDPNISDWVMPNGRATLSSALESLLIESMVSIYFIAFFGALFLTLGAALVTLLLGDFALELLFFFYYCKLLKLGSFSAKASRNAPPDEKTLSSSFYSACIAEYSIIS